MNPVGANQPGAQAGAAGQANNGTDPANSPQAQQFTQLLGSLLLKEVMKTAQENAG